MFTIACRCISSLMNAVSGNVDVKVTERNAMRLGLPSKGRLASDTFDFLKDCQLSAWQLKPRPYVADIPQVRYFLLVAVVSNLFWLFMYIKNVLNLVSDQLDGPGTWGLTKLA
ncbi:putative ATP phosphoribosyltransferase [Helianthus annuus]|nr:putative ATP phosphoribosyltransferase [Helianthus annuus]